MKQAPMGFSGACYEVLGGWEESRRSQGRPPVSCLRLTRGNATFSGHRREKSSCRVHRCSPIIGRVYEEPRVWESGYLTTGSWILCSLVVFQDPWPA